MQEFELNHVCLGLNRYNYTQEKVLVPDQGSEDYDYSVGCVLRASLGILECWWQSTEDQAGFAVGWVMDDGIGGEVPVYELLTFWLLIGHVLVTLL